MNSRAIAISSAVALFAAGLVLLFASDDVLPRLIADFPVSGAWLGQVLGATWLGVAILNWLQRGALIGGIYGRPVVFTNLMIYVVSTFVLFDAAQADAFPAPLLGLTVAAVLFGAAYASLLFGAPARPRGVADSPTP